ncbi:MAG TPA: SDR family oxidoreductase [Thermoplasmatales archaeon]|nr:SDR family oxidoreductase [Thermoplasmatales archaeon]
MKISLEGRRALITASSKGIGFGVAKVMALAGASVILLSRNEENLKRAKEKIEEMGRGAEYIVADLSKKDDLRNVAEMAGDVDIFFFSTGGPKPGNFMELDMDDWERAVDLLLYPAVYLTKAFLPHMMEKRWGRIIYSTSVAIKEPIMGLTLSNVVRISMAGLVRTLAKEVGTHGITVNGIMPGIIRTGRMMEIAAERGRREGKSTEEVLEEYAEPIPAARLGEPEEIGYLAAFLASDYASYINGAMIPVDGGRLNSVL